jgi:hypothetical protein
MTTETLRKNMAVTSWSLTANGLTISYTREDKTPQIRHLILTPLETLNELYMVGSVEDKNEQSIMGMMDGCWYHFANLVKSYKMCQWEALSIAIRHEEEKNLEDDLNMLELNAFIDAMK